MPEQSNHTASYSVLYRADINFPWTHGSTYANAETAGSDANDMVDAGYEAGVWDDNKSCWIRF